MKRLLLPLLAALALPTSVIAFPWNKDIVEENLAGEKFIVKEKSIESYDKGFYALKYQYDQAIPYLEKTINTKTDREISNYYHPNCQTTSYYQIVKIDREYCNKKTSRDGLKSILTTLKKYESLIDTEIENNGGFEEVHIAEIKYQPIKVNLNGQKQALQVYKTKCINPNMSDDAFNAWNELYKYWYTTNLRSSIEFKKEYQLDQKVCDKYFSKN